VKRRRVGRYRARLRCVRKGHAYERLLEPPYERCLRCGRVPAHTHHGATPAL